MALAVVNRRLHHLAFGREPEAVVNQLGIARHHLVFQMSHAAVEGQAFHGAVGDMPNGAAGRLVNATVLHADKAVFDQVQAADAVVPAQFVQAGQQCRRRQVDPIDADRVAGAEADLDLGRAVGRGLRRDGALEHILLRRHRRILQNLTLARGMQQVGVDRERRFAALVMGDRDLMLLGVIDQLRARGEVPFPPGRDNLDARFERVAGQFEAHLIIALAGGPVRHRVGAGLGGDFDQAFGDQRPGDRGAEQVATFIQGVCAKHRHDEVAHEFLAQILDIDFLDAEHLGFGAGRLQFLALAQIGGEGDHLAVIGLLQPFQNDRGVQAAGIGEDDFVHGRGHGACFLLSSLSRGPVTSRAGV